ncbi:DUF2955 domain-containing protein [Lysobacter arvi]|uniref:DUF2955 domain-containing protein n=1 Tax=Lysobacter arvi TaxID=3038776 RepID=A0ABU1C9Z9_9GAMM|nr:DUF2955 domain-containing protein [Lysobacter arvi]MDR0182016.1 DUF2955 domain-containing protein [Lysobacter arvi]
MSTEAVQVPEPTRSALNEHAWRQACRIAIGSTLGLAVVKLADWPFGVFFALYPVLLLGLVPVLKLPIALQFIASSVVSIAMVNLLGLLGNASPVLAAMVFFAFSLLCFRLMAAGPLFLFGALSMVATSVLVHLASYPQVPKDDLFTAQFLATLLAVIIAGLVHALLPEKRDMVRPGGQKPLVVVRHQMLLGAVCASASFIAFQLLDLSDSLSAQAATVLILFPMSLEGGRNAAWTRVAGTLLGTLFALALQLVLYTHVSQVWLIVALYGTGMLLFAVMHVRENRGPAVGLSGATALAVLIGQLLPTGDLYGVSLYRFSSVAVAVGAMLLCIFAVDWFLRWYLADRALFGDRPSMQTTPVRDNREPHER